MISLPAPIAALAGKFNERHLRWLVAAVNGALAVAVGYALARLLWTLLPIPAAMTWHPAPAAVAAPSAPAAAGTNLEAVVSAHLFGQYQAPTTQANLEAAPETHLNLTLFGILAGSTDTDSRALIGQQNGDEAPYAVGQDVVHGVTLQAIFPDRVILSRNGSLETLRLDKDAPIKGSAPAAVANNNSGDDDNDSSPGPANSGLAQIRETILSDPSKAADYIRVQPAVSPGGGTRGYRIYPGKDRTIFTSAGLRPGDLVTAVNGIQLDDGQKALQTLNDLKGAGSVTLTLERGGQTQTVNVSLSNQ
ncbi:MAG TPA: type II secretion system protein GspC [Nevskiaceae bacterium]|nr:type II secretion system protein GspC [Nevskiaceae bacterium]